jgi:hypothetical protein
MGYRIAGIDIHKRMLAIVVADVAVDGEFQFERRMIGTSPAQLHALADWCVANAVEEIVMESTAQYWRPVWEALERHWQPRCRAREDAGPLSGALHLAQAPDALGACAHLHPVYRRLLQLALTELRGIEGQIEALNQELAGLLRGHQAAIERLAAVPGLGVDSAQQIVAEVGPTAAAFPSPKQMSSWVGACPGAEESAGVSYSRRPPKGNRQMRRLLTTSANAAVKTTGSIFEYLYRRWVGRLGHRQAIGAVAHRLCRLIWKILHDGITYEERGPAVTKERLRARTAKMIRELRGLGYRVEPV